uniref:Acyl-coenzyme A thioesterase 9, mitochondrial (inferred by orthology to a human protein) n=1 Tax=Strongyloides venezuelensis TaxID=75913 RepID=A0A0K0FLC7_STRVS
MLKNLAKFNYKCILVGRRFLFQENPQFDVNDIKTTYYMRSHVDEYIQNLRKCFFKLQPQRNFNDRTFKNEKLSMTSSRCQFKIPLKESEDVRRMYTSTGTKLRIGKILEDLDMFAVYLTYLYADGDIFKDKNLFDQIIAPRVVVTAAIGKLTLNEVLNKNDENLIFDGFVNYVGRSSALNIVRMYQKQGNIFKKLLECKVIMVSKDFNNINKTLPLPQLKLESEEEKRLFDEGKKYNDEFKRLMNTNFSKTAFEGFKFCKKSNQSDFLLNRIDEDSLSLKTLKPFETTISKVSLCNSFVAYAQSKNYHGTVFGGLIMRKGIELASIAVNKFCEDKVYLCCLGNIVFRKPIDVGSIIDLSATISYIDDCYIQVRIFYEVSSIDKAFEKYTSNIMQCTFKYDGSKKLKKLHLNKINDIIIMLDGKFHLEEAKKALNA